MRFALLGLFLLGGTLRAEVRVLLFQKERPGSIHVFSPCRFLADGLDLGSAEELSVEAKKGHLVWRLKNGGSGEADKLTLQPRGAPLRLGTAQGWTGTFDGELTVEIEKDRLRVINRVDEESYVRSTVGRELPADWPLEAVKAQAVLARTFLPANRGRHVSDGADVCDLTHCQAFGGRVSRAGVDRAVQETAGLILVQDGRPSALSAELRGLSAPRRGEGPSALSAAPFTELRGQAAGQGPEGSAELRGLSAPRRGEGPSALSAELRGLSAPQRGESPSDVFFHSDCGGHTAWARDVWPGGSSDLAGSTDGPEDRPYCADAPRHRWRAEISGLELALLLGVDESSGDMTVTSRDRSGRAAQLRWGSRDLTGESLYLAWGRKRGWHELRSTRFTVNRKGNLFVFEGTGLGHGVGLCQYGARGRARDGQGFREILRHYFPAADVRSRVP